MQNKNNDIAIYSKPYDNDYNHRFKAIFEDMKTDYYQIGYKQALLDVLLLNEFKILPKKHADIVNKILNDYICKINESEFYLYGENKSSD